MFDGADPAPDSAEGLLVAVKALEAEVEAMRMSALATRNFELDGRHYGYHVARGNRTWDNERAVEIPVVWAAVQGRARPESIIEVGNVLGHYFEIGHRVLDLYERHRCVTWNEDILEFQPPSAPELVVSISTLEHVGHSDGPRRPEKFKLAVETIVDWLAPDGRALFTVPLGYNPSVLDYLEDHDPQVRSMLFMRRVTLDNLWEQTTLSAVREYRYGKPFPAANALAIVELGAR